MSFQAYVHLVWVIQFACWIVLLYLFWSRAIARAFPSFVGYIGLTVAANVASIIIIRNAGLDSAVYKAYYWISTDVAYLLQLAVAWGLYRLLRVGRSGWVWAWMSVTGSLLAWQVSERSISNWHILFTAGVLHVQLYLVIAILIQIMRNREFRLGMNAAGVLGFITITVVLNYCIFSAQLFQGLNYTLMRWLLQPSALLATVVAIIGAKRPDLPRFEWDVGSQNGRRPAVESTR